MTSASRYCIEPSMMEGKQVTFASLISALSFALDLTEGACEGHAVRTCILGMKLGLELGLPEALLSDLYYSLLLKDVGCDNNAYRMSQILDETSGSRGVSQIRRSRNEPSLEVKYLRMRLVDGPGPARADDILFRDGYPHRDAEELIRGRCERAASVIRDLGLGPSSAGAVYCLDEHWDGSGFPDHLAGEEIPLLARIVGIAQTLEVFHRLHGPLAALDVIERRAGHWFDPSIVRAALSSAKGGLLWEGIEDHLMHGYALALEPNPRGLLTDAFVIDRICGAFAGVVDAKSPFTYTHSTGVTRAAVRMGKVLCLNPRDLTVLRRASLLHDIGKLSVPNYILDKPGPLTGEEWRYIEKHPMYTFEILNRIPGFEEIARVAATHHEKLDGSGYHMGLQGTELCQMSRILTVADMFDALVCRRPYRQQLDTDQVLSILRKETPHCLDTSCVEALAMVADDLARQSATTIVGL